MSELLHNTIANSTGATSFELTKNIQSLWSGYGVISRYRLTGSNQKYVVVKHIKPPLNPKHPRGWNTESSHQRKVKSYEVERLWYENFANYCNRSHPVPRCFGSAAVGDEYVIVLEDLSEAGFPVVKTEVGMTEIHACLKWLASFHGQFLGVNTHSLWQAGTYWHLATRQEELKALDDIELQRAAPHIEAALQSCQYQTLVHGDAKLGNFCFSQDGCKVAAIDFQYVGGGCGMKDVAYFLGSCVSPSLLASSIGELLHVYFQHLSKTVALRSLNCDVGELVQTWQALYPFAVADFYRFLKGWSPDHWKINDQTEQMTRDVLHCLGS